MGRHNREIYGGILGLSEAEIRNLEAERVIAGKKGQEVLVAVSLLGRGSNCGGM